MLEKIQWPKTICGRMLRYHGKRKQSFSCFKVFCMRLFLDGYLSDYMFYLMPIDPLLMTWIIFPPLIGPSSLVAVDPVPRV